MKFDNEVALLKEQVMQYANDSLDGTIRQCVAMKWSMKRFLKDVERAETDEDCPFYIEWNELFRFYRWAKLFKHTKGVLAGQPIELHISQLWEACNIFCFKNKADGARRFRKVYIQKARKNAKTQFLAIVSSYIASLSNEMEEIYIAGWIKDQSDLCYNEIVNQIHGADLLKGKFREAYKKLTFSKNGSVIKALSREARKRGDGTNPSVGIIDEYGTAHETNEIVDGIETGFVSRFQPLLAYITTAGFDLSYPCYSFYGYCKDIINPETDTENDTIFVAIYELDQGDDVKDESNWIKANPIVATYPKGLEYLRNQLKEALDQPEKMRSFMTKNMDVWVDQKETGFLKMNKWNERTVDDDYIKDFLQGASVYYGIDLSSKVDLTSLGWVAVKEGRYVCGQLSYMPSNTFNERMSRDRIRFDLFEERGELTLTDGDVVDYAYLKEDLMRLSAMYGCKSVGVDMWNGTYFFTELASEGVEIVEVKQTIVGLTEATKGFRDALYSGKLHHADDKLLKWSASNAVVDEDSNQNIKISKKKSRDKIDPLAAIINAFSLAMYDSQNFNLNDYVMSGKFSF